MKRPPGDESDYDGDNEFVVRVPLAELMRVYRVVDEAFDPDCLDRAANYRCMQKAGFRPVWTWRHGRNR